MPIFAWCKNLWHASIATTQVYTKVTPEGLMEVYRMAHPLLTNGDKTPSIRGTAALGGNP